MLAKQLSTTVQVEGRDSISAKPKFSIELTPEQIKFLKLFAKNHYNGAKENFATAHPLHVVETKVVDYIPYNQHFESMYCKENEQ